MVVAAGRPGRSQIVGLGTIAYDDATPATADTIYDVASLTKPVVTTALAMRLVARGALALDAPARALVPELVADGDGAVRIAHLAGHASGLPAHVELFRRLWAGERAGAPTAREAILRMAGATPLERAPGVAASYSDLGYLLLGAAVERAGGTRLDRLAAAEVFAPLGMTSSFFVDLERAGARDPRAAAAAPTERCARRGLVRGEVHDENAHAAGGVCGHAGLFSTAADLARFAAALAAAADGDAEAGAPFDPATVRHFLATAAAPATTWRLGWDTPEPAMGVSSAGDRWPRDGVGHLAFTGCSIWLDPRRRRHVVILSNRVHPTRDNQGIRELRRALMDAAATWLDV